MQLADYASSFCGAEILHETGSYKQRGNSIRELITDFWSSRLFISSASSILHPDIHPGQCWPCVPPCTVRIKLCHPTKVKAFSIHHIAASLSVSVYGDRGEYSTLFHNLIWPFYESNRDSPISVLRQRRDGSYLK